MSIVNILPEDKIVTASLDNESAKNEFLLKRTFQYLKKNPLNIIILIPVKLKDYLHPFNGRWYPLSLGSKFDLFYGLLACFAILGFWWNIKTNAKILQLCFCFFIGAIISVIIFHGEIRYRFVLNPILFLLAGLCFADRLNPEKRKIMPAIILLNLIIWGAGIAIP
jgi:hypothetical protein